MKFEHRASQWTDHLQVFPWATLGCSGSVMSEWRTDAEEGSDEAAEAWFRLEAWVLGSLLAVSLVLPWL
jgi:hypothetical protein